jgi:(p)ppGpp synthase/HD superfamily hydrolase
MNALQFATKAHGSQTRKYTGEPYINHPIEVAGLVVQCVPDHTPQMVMAALLHDVVEDTEHTVGEIEQLFGIEVALLVADLTDISQASDGNRAARKALDLAHTANASPQAKTIKLADLISNSQSIVQHDKDFARVYLKEKAALLEVLKEGNRTLWDRAKRILDESLQELNSQR